MKSTSLDAGKRIEAYYRAAPPFARAICRKLRQIIMKAEPGITEEWKWGPHYSKNGMVCGVGAFKNHVSLAFFQGSSMKDPKRFFMKEAALAKSMRRIQFESIDDVHEKTIASYVKEAVTLNLREDKKKEQVIEVPADLARLLARQTKIKLFFDTLSYTHRKEYIRWIGDAKKEATRNTRIRKTVAMLKAKAKHP